MDTFINIFHIIIFISLSCLSLSSSAINNLRNAFFLLARQEISLNNLTSSSDPLIHPCKSEGIWPHPASCAEYVLCKRQRTVMVIEHYRCSFGIFDITSQKCNWAKLSAPCKEGNVSFNAEVMTVAMPVSGVSKLPGNGRKTKRKSQLRPSSYVSELSGLTCKIAGYFPHPTNNTKFYRCVELSPGTFMVYLFSCEPSLIYEPTVRACVKAQSEERMEPGEAYPLLTQTPSWVVERCRSTQFPAQLQGRPNTLFRNPVNCRRFFRCSSTLISLKIEQFSCPTGLFFDEQRNSCTWASDTTECVSMVDDADTGRNTSVTWKPTPPPKPTFATVWVTMPRKVTRVPNPNGEVFVPVKSTTMPSISMDNEIKYLPKLAYKPVDDRLLFGDINSVMGTDTDPNWLFKQALKPPPYLTATGVLVTEPNEFKCTAPGTFPTAVPCIFWKCEKYSWVKSFLLFRFTCPPHTVFNNGTCEYNATMACANSENLSTAGKFTTDSSLDVGDITSATLSPMKNIQSDRPRLLCTKDGTFPLPFATPCSTRFMVCRRLAGPLHFFVSVHDCPPSLVFSVVVNQCVDPATEHLQCAVGSFDLSGLGDSEEDTSVTSPPDTLDTVAVCTVAGFSKISCKRFRRCEWIADPGLPSGTWISYDFECGRNMVFDENVVACVQQTDPAQCVDVPATTGIPTETVTEADISEPERNESDTTDVVDQVILDALADDLTTPVPLWTLPGLSRPDTRDSSTLAESIVTRMTSTERSSGISGETEKLNEHITVLPTKGPVEESLDVFKKSRSPICYRSGYFLYPDDNKCQRFYRCLQLTPEPNSFVMLHYRCDDGYVFDPRYFACSAVDSAPPCIPPNTESIPPETPQLSSSLTSPEAADRTNTLPVKILPQVWHMSTNDSANTGALICTTQRIYRLQTCGYYYSCIETETKGQFHLQEIYCETLYLDISTGQCIPPPPNDPCNANSITRFSSIWSVRKPTRPMQDVESTTATALSTTTTTLPSTTTTATETTTTATTRTPETTTTTTSTTATPTTSKPTSRRAANSKRRRLPQVPAAIKIQGTKNNSNEQASGPVFINPAGTPEYFTIPKNRISTGVYSPVAQPVLQTNRYQGPPGVPPQFAPLGSLSDLLSNNPALKNSNDFQSLSAYRDSFNQLYAQMTGSAYTTLTTTTTVAPALVLNFNSASEPVGEMVKAGVSFQCRSEGYFRNARDISCSKFYLCVKVGPRQYNLFEFMCLPRNGIQWKYHQDKKACVEPTDVKEC